MRDDVILLVAVVEVGTALEFGGETIRGRDHAGMMADVGF